MTALFGGLDLGTPAQRNETILRRELELRRKRWLEADHSNTAIYAGYGDFLLRHGQFYPGRIIPDQYAHLQGAESQCFWNAMAACEATPELRYCEGVYTLGQGIFVPHAWCVAPDGCVVEVTFPSRDWERCSNAETKLPYLAPECWAYWGAFFEPALARAMSEAYGMPMLGRSEAEIQRHGDGPIDVAQPTRLPLLDVPYDPARKELP